MINKLLDAIGTAEGARPDYWKGNPYDLTLGRMQLLVPLTQLTVAEVKSLQKKMVASGMKSSAVGKYQFISKTLNELQKTLKFSDDDLFNAELQDKMAIKLLERRGLKQFLNGEISVNAFMKNLSKEWASLPNPDTGKSYYGQRTHYTVDQMRNILDTLSAEGGQYGK